MLKFFKKFIYYTMSVFGLISLSLIPAKLYSQQQTHNPWLNLRKTVALLSPHDNQKLQMTVISWLEFIVDSGNILMMRKDLVSATVKTKARFFDHLLQRYKTNIAPLEMERLLNISAILESSDPKTQPMRSLLLAVVNKDDGFLRQLSLQQKTLLFDKVVALQSIVSPDPIIWDFLTEAILANNLTAVRMILESDIRKQNKAEKYRFYNNIDPLSLSLVNYASLPNVHTSKKMALQIVRLMAEHTPNVNEISSLTWQIPPITWALILGLTDEVEYLINYHQARPVSKLEIANTIMNIEIDLLEYLELRKFNKLNQYIKQFELDDLVEDCKTVFH